jgi:transposase-like protein
MAKARRIDDELEARRCLRAVEAAGGSLAVWCREHGIDGRSLNAWRVNLARRGSKVTKSQPRRKRTVVAGGLVELVRAPAAVTAPASATRYVLEVGSARVEFDDDFREETLARIVSVLRAC